MATPSGPARVRLSGAPGGPLLLLGHGAGGGSAIWSSADVRAATCAALELGWQVGLVEQPWHVAGRRVAEAPPRLDAAWLAVVAALRTRGVQPALVVGGRSAGARVACRTAGSSGAVAVLALAFPLKPPGRPDRSRARELAVPAVPRLVVQGSRDAFGVPAPEPGVEVHVVAGADHGFAVRRRDGRTAADVEREVREVVCDWLRAQRLT